MDSWYYFGHFLHFPRFQNVTPTYGGERMTWIVPGMILVRLFGPMAGDLLLHTAFAGFSLCAFHYILKRLTDARTAFFTAVLLAVHPFFIGANGWDYLDGGSLLYQLLALAFLRHADVSRRPTVFLLLSAVAWWAVIYTYLAWTALTPAYLYLLYAWSPPKESFGRKAAGLIGIFAGGFLVMTAYMAGAYYGLGARGPFFANNLRTAFQIANLAKNPWLDPAWMSYAYWLVFPAIAYGVAIVTLGRYLAKRVKLTSPQRDVLIYFLYCASIMIVMTIRQSRLLAFDYFASILLAGTFLSLGVGLYRPPAGARAGLYTAVLLLAAAISALPLTRPMLFSVVRHWQIAAVLVVTIAASACLRWLHPDNRAAWATCILALSVLTFALTPGFPAQAWKASYDGPALMTRVAHAVDLISQHTPPGKYPLFWFDNESDQLTGEYRSIWCALEARRPAMLNFPKIDPESRFPAGMLLVVIDRRPGLIDAAARSLAQDGMPLSPAGRDRIDSPLGTYWLAYFDVLAAGAPATRE